MCRNERRRLSSGRGTLSLDEAADKTGFARVGVANDNEVHLGATVALFHLRTYAFIVQNNCANQSRHAFPHSLHRINLVMGSSDALICFMSSQKAFGL